MSARAMQRYLTGSPWKDDVAIGRVQEYLGVSGSIWDPGWGILGRRGCWTAASPATTYPTAPEDSSPEALARVGGSRWRVETELETEKSDVGLDEYETRTWAGWHHHVAPCLLGGATLLSLQQAWRGKDARDHPAPGLPGGAGDAAPGTVRAG